MLEFAYLAELALLFALVNYVVTSIGKDDWVEDSTPDLKNEKCGGLGKIAFFCGNPMVEIIKGIIHIYKNK